MMEMVVVDVITIQVTLLITVDLLNHSHKDDNNFQDQPVNNPNSNGQEPACDKHSV